MVDRTVVLRKLSQLDVYLQQIGEYAGVTPKHREDFVRFRETILAFLKKNSG